MEGSRRKGAMGVVSTTAAEVTISLSDSRNGTGVDVDAAAEVVAVVVAADEEGVACHCLLVKHIHIKDPSQR
jgi:hypothetical protein